jgi:hypothetical protein
VLRSGNLLCLRNLLLPIIPGTWDIILLLSHAVPIICKCVFKIKTKSNGSIERYKVRLVARGFQKT